MERAYQDAMAFKEMRMQAEKEEEDHFRKMMMAKFAEDDRIDQMNAQRRRMKQLEHKREVEKLIEDRRRQREAVKVQQTLYPIPFSICKHSAGYLKCDHFKVQGNCVDNYISISSRKWRLKKEQWRSKERCCAER